MDTSGRYKDMDYLSLTYETNPIDKERKEDTYLKLNILPIEVLYNSELV